MIIQEAIIEETTWKPSLCRGYNRGNYIEAKCAISRRKIKERLEEMPSWWHKREVVVVDKSIEIRQIKASSAFQNAVSQQDSEESVHEQLEKPASLSVIAKALLLTRRRLKIEPAKNLNFLYEPGKQVSSAVKMKNAGRSPVAFKFQTNNPKSCFMRPPNGILAPGETLITTVVKFIEPPEQNHQQKIKNQDKFKIVSLKVKEGTSYAEELFSDNKEFVAVERVLRVVFLDPAVQGQSHEIEKLKKRLAEAEAAQQSRKANKPVVVDEIKAEKPADLVDHWKDQERQSQSSHQHGEEA